MSAAHLFVALALAAGPGAAVVAAASRRRPTAAASRASRVLAVGALAALALLLVGPSGDDALVGPISTGPFAALVLVLVLGVAATVLSFAARALRHEPYQLRFAIVGALVASAAAFTAAAADLALLGVAWVATSALTVALVATGPDAGRWERTARLRRTFLLGDAFVLAGLALLATSSGTTAIAELDGGGRWAALAGCALVLGAAARSAAAPFHRWLPDTLGAPTPSSALLHGGVVNGGAVLLIALAPAISPHLGPAALAIVIGGASCAFAEAVMLTRADVKGALVWSTIAQMSFTLVLCGLGLEIAAALHLVAHGMYKASLFLGSGGTVRHLARNRAVAPTEQRPLAALAWAGPVALGAVAIAAVALSGVEVSPALVVPVALAWVTAAVALHGWLHRAGSRNLQLAGTAGAAALLGAFVLVTVAIKLRVAPGIAEAEPIVPAAVLVAVVLPLVAIIWASRRPEATAAPLWQAARRAGRTAPPARRSTRPTASPSLPHPSSGLAPGLTGGR